MTQMAVRRTHLSYDEQIELTKQDISALVSEADEIASRVDATTGFRLYAAVTYSIRKVAGNTVNGMISIPQIITSSTLLPGMIDAVRHPLQTVSAAATAFGTLSTSDKMTATAEMLLMGGGNAIGALATRIPRAGGYLAGRVGYSVQNGFTLAANGKVYGFTTGGLPAMSGPLAAQRGAVAPVRFGEIERPKSGPSDSVRYEQYWDELGRTPGSLNDRSARAWYLSEELKIPTMLDSSAPLELQARRSFEIRNSIRSQARGLMADQRKAEFLRQTEPNLTWDQLVATKSLKYSGDDLWESIIYSSRKSRTSVNAQFGFIGDR